ncbi:MAG: c-type cytochrome [Thermaurantimonas sp.]
MKRKIFNWGILFTAMVILLQCTRRNEEDLKSICFESEILPIIQSNCASAGCHDATTAADGYDLTTYRGIMRTVKPGNGTGSKIVKVMRKTDDDDRMPPPPAAPMNQEFIDLMIQWIDKGAANITGCSEATNCDTSDVSYARDIQSVLQNYCVSCHAASAPSGGVVLNTYQGVKTVSNNGKLIGSVFHLPGFYAMPPSGIKLPDCELQKIRAWVNRGAPNN